MKAGGPELGVRLCWRPLGVQAHLPQDNGPMTEGQAGPVQWDPHQAKQYPPGWLCGAVRPGSSPTQRALCLRLRPLHPVFRFSLPSQLLPLVPAFLSNSPPLSPSAPSLHPKPPPPHLGAPLPCIMHAVEAPNRIRHLRPSSRRESLCK